MLNLAGQIAIVTGAGRGAGRAWALALAQAGATVMALDVNPTLAEEVATAIRAQGGAAQAYTVDVSNKMAVQTALYEILETHEQLHWLVNAAHVVPPSPALKLDEWEWNRSIDVNLKGAFLVAQTVARAMQATGGGHIINLVRPAASITHAAVRAAREGLVGLTAALQAEWQAFNITVRVVASDANPTAVLADSEWLKV